MQRLTRTFRAYPRPFRVLLIATFVDGVGGALVFPFFALYITDKFGVGLAQAGIALGIFALTRQIGSLIGGALADSIGRRAMIIFGLIASATASLLLGLLNDLSLIYLAAAGVGVFAAMGSPAQQAVIGDILPAEQRAEGYGLWRVADNLAVVIGPLLGGLIATRSYLALFVLDALAGLLMALFVAARLPETRPGGPVSSSLGDALREAVRGYSVIARDRLFAIYLVLMTLLTLAYMQINHTLPVFMRDEHGFPPTAYALILSMNAAIVVIAQFAVTRRSKEYAAPLMLAVGGVLYGISYALFGVAETLVVFAGAMIILTIGEMIAIPVSQAFVMALAPEAMRGRYAGANQLAWTIPGMFGATLAGLVMARTTDGVVWFIIAGVALIAAAGFLLLHITLKRQRRSAED